MNKLGLKKIGSHSFRQTSLNYWESGIIEIIKTDLYHLYVADAEIGEGFKSFKDIASIIH